MASVNLGKIAFKWRNSYSSNTTYVKQDVVSYNGDSFICILDNTTSVTPTTANTTNWNLFAQGTQGISNTAGQIIYNNGSGLVALANGTSGQVLTISANTGMPVWANPDVRSSTRVKTLPASSRTSRNTTTYRTHGAIMNDDSLRMWGTGPYYMLGDGANVSRSLPVRAGFPPGFVGVKEVYMGHYYNILVIDLDNKLWIWGYNGYGQCGTGNTTDQRVPYCASNNASNSIYGKSVTDVAMCLGTEGLNSYVVLCSDGTVHGVGYNGYGQLGDGTTTTRNNFVQCSGLTGITQIAGGRERYSSYYAVKSNGTLYAWGYNGDGQLGVGNTTSNYYTPTNISANGSLSGKTIVKAFGGYLVAYALDSAGGLHAWGNGNYGQHGAGNTSTEYTPVQVNSSVADLYAGGYDYAMVLIKKTDKTLWGAGYGGYTTNGDTNSTTSGNWIQIPVGNTVVKAVRGGSGSYNYGIALLENGTVYGWGYNGNGALCTGSTSSSVNVSTPQLIPTGNRTVTDICCWGSSSEQAIGMLMDDGQLFVAGYAGGSSLPDDDSENSYAPMPVIF